MAIPLPGLVELKTTQGDPRSERRGGASLLGALGAILGPLGAILAPLGLTWGGPGGVLERSWPPKKTLKTKTKKNSETITYNLCARVDFWSFLDALLVPRNRCVPGGFVAKHVRVLNSRAHLCACTYFCVRVDF